MLNSITYSLPRELEESLRKEVSASEASNKISRIWNRDASVWSGEDGSKWLGWLDILSEETNNLETYKKFGEDVRANFKSILLMGMGGSSLAPEVLAMTFEKSNFRILDSTVPAQVKTLENSLDLMNTLFIVSSKSGSTLEPNCFKQYFLDRVSQAAGNA